MAETSPNNLGNYEAFLGAFEKTPRLPKRMPTVFDIAKYPHYENVCSNILGFFFDTQECHGLRDLALKSLLQVYDTDLGKHSYDTRAVKREEPTESQNRLDLLVDAGDYVVAIENKIWASLYNDLVDYAKHVEMRFPQAFRRIYIVLSIREIPDEILTSNFKSVRYHEFIAAVRRNMDDYLHGADNYYVRILVDFMNSIENLTRGVQVNEEMRNFFIDNEKTYNELLGERKKLEQALIEKCLNLQRRVSSSVVSASNVRQWVNSQRDLVHDITLENGLNIAVDCWSRLDGWVISIWLRSGEVPSERAKYFLNDLAYFVQHPIPQAAYPRDNNYRINLPFYTPIEEVARQLIEILEGIHF